MAKGDKFIVLFKVWKRQLSCPTHCFQGGISAPLQLLGEWSQFLLGKHFIETTNTHIHRVNCATTKQLNDSVAELLHLETALHNVCVILCHMHGRWIAEEV